MLKRLCNYMNKNDLVFNNYIYESCISPCCYDYNKKINLKILENDETTYKSICSMINMKVALTENELKHRYPDCYYCEYRNQKNSSKNNKIDFVNLSMYPSPCQCNCIYCDIRKNRKFMTLCANDIKQYQIIFEIINKLTDNGYITNNTIWQVACGEITIHPFKNMIYDYTKDKKVTYFTNCFLYDNDLGKILDRNKNSKINFSIDSGDDTTWSSIKGVNNFQIVLKNLSTYIENSSPEQVELKYILLSGINDNMNNFIKVIKIMKQLKLKKIIISRNYDVELTDSLINAKNNFVALLKNNDICYELSSF